MTSTRIQCLWRPLVAAFVAAAAAAACTPAERLLRTPPSALREGAPPALQASARAVGDDAPAFTLEGTAGTQSLSALRADGPAVLVFYRGDW